MACGCEERREIMFTLGQPGIVEGAIIATAVIALAITFHRKVRS